MASAPDAAEADARDGDRALARRHPDGAGGRAFPRVATTRAREQQAVSPEMVASRARRAISSRSPSSPSRASPTACSTTTATCSGASSSATSPPGPIVGVQVFVELHSNEGTYPYRQSFSIDDTVLDLSPQVRIALTSDLARTLDELLRTSLYVQINWGEHEIFRQTFPVTMAPVDEWASNTDKIGPSCCCSSFRATARSRRSSSRRYISSPRCATTRPPGSTATS